MSKPALVLVCLLTLPQLIGCQTSEPQELWASHRPASYVVEICSGYKGAPNQCARTAVSPTDPSQPDPLAALFELEKNGCANEISYDDGYGFVRAVHADCGEEAYDTVVDCFVPDVSSIDACAAGRNGN